MRLLVLASLLIFFASCNYTIEKKKDNGFVTGSINMEALSYGDVREHVFNPKCVSCHGNSGGISLADYESIKSNIDLIVETIDNGTMPKLPTPPLSDEQKKILKQWIKLGMPEGAFIPEVLEPKFASIKKLIFGPKCISCHSVGGKAEKIPLETADDLINSPRELVIPGNAEESGLYLSVFRDDDKRMPPPEVANKLSDKEISIIVEWIQKGAKD